MSGEPLLLEIGCEEIPARMVAKAAADLSSIVVDILDRGGLAHGAVMSWGGSRRLAVRLQGVAARQADREELVLGPPAAVAFTADGEATKAAIGFAGKQGIAPEALSVIETDKGGYAGFHRQVTGLTAGELLARELPGAVGNMSFPKSMRWGDGSPRWVRPVHWLLALHGGTVLSLELFGISATASSEGHRFMSSGPVEIGYPERYEAALESAGVVVDPAVRRERLLASLNAAAADLGGELVSDERLLEEVVHLVEWPGIAGGRFDGNYLELPRELLVTTLRHHQKCFSVQSGDGDLLPAFLAVANTDRDPGGHVQRGNEWVVVGRLEDARFFWNEDRKRALPTRSGMLDDVVFHKKTGSYGEKARRMERLAAAVAERLQLDDTESAICARAALLAKNDLVTGTVGEFPELQGLVGGLMLGAEGEPQELAGAVYSHYKPAGPHDDIPPTAAGGVVAVADKLDSITCLIAAGETPTGSKDPFGLRRACSGIFRILAERRWPLSMADLQEIAGMDDGGRAFMLDRLQNYLREAGATANEVKAVLRPRVDASEALHWRLYDILDRLQAIGTVRKRADFALLADLTKRVDNILTKGQAMFEAAESAAAEGFEEDKSAALALREMIDRYSGEIAECAAAGEYQKVIDILGEFIEPVERFFTDVLVLDPDNPGATLNRKKLLTQLSGVLTRCFDIRELAGQAERREHRG